MAHQLILLLIIIKIILISICVRIKKRTRTSFLLHILTLILIVTICSMVISGTMLYATQHATAHSHAYKSTTTTPTNDIDTIDTSTNDTNFLAYENSTLGMMILYPPDWKVAQAKDNNSSSNSSSGSSSGSVRFIAPPQLQNTTSSISHESLEVDVMDLSHWNAYLKSHPLILSNSSATTIAGGIPSNMTIYSEGYSIVI